MLEQSLLSCCIRSKEAFYQAYNLLQSSDFSHELYQNIFTELGKFYFAQQNGSHDELLIYLLQKTNIPSAELRELIDADSVASNLAIYINAVKSDAKKRKLIKLAGDFKATLEGAPHQTDQIIDNFRSDFAKITDGNQRNTSVHLLVDLFNEYIAGYEQRSRGQRDSHIPTGFGDLDKALKGGLTRGGLHVIAAPTGIGKTTFALNIAQHVAFNVGKRVDIFSLEMTANEIFLKMLSALTQYKHDALQDGSLTQAQLEDLVTNWLACADKANRRVAIHDQEVITIEAITASLVAYYEALEQDIGLVIVDYLQLVKPSERAQNRNEEVARISRELKCLATKINAPVIAISQLNRKHSTEKRDGYKFNLSDLRDSGAIEQDATTILFLNRDPRGFEKEKAQLSIAKSRFGGECEIELFFDGNTNTFKEQRPWKTERV